MKRYCVVCDNCNNQIVYKVEGLSYVYKNISYPIINPSLLSPPLIYIDSYGRQRYSDERSISLKVNHLRLPHIQPDITWGYCNECSEFRPIAKKVRPEKIKRGIRYILKMYKKITRPILPLESDSLTIVDYLDPIMTNYLSILMAYQNSGIIAKDHCVECKSTDIDYRLPPHRCPLCGGVLKTCVFEVKDNANNTIELNEVFNYFNKRIK